MKIDLSYGSGGRETGKLIHEIFLSKFSNEHLDKLEDAAVFELSGKVAYTTDSFVVTPLFFPGGDIGRLAVCGTVNDLLCMGAVPKYLTVGFIIEEGLDTDVLEQVAESMRLTAIEAGVQIVAGDTKVIDGKGGLYINTSGIGMIPEGRDVSIYRCRPGDALILSGNIGDHHACIMSKRMGIENNIQSDCAPLNTLVNTLYQHNIDVRAMRDVTRGGLATILNEIAEASCCAAQIQEEALPISREVAGLCNILGLDPLYMGNEGKLLMVVPQEQAQLALDALHSTKLGTDAAIIGQCTEGNGITLITRLGGKRIVDILYGEGLPRIC